jgi:hypothetical protein
MHMDLRSKPFDVAAMQTLPQVPPAGALSGQPTFAMLSHDRRQSAETSPASAGAASPYAGKTVMS